jgi:succinyl-diaminopimelate desuccinylase
VNDRAAEVQDCLEPRADEMAGLLEELIARDTENPPGRRLSECGQLLSDAMARLGFAPELLEVPPIAALEDPCIVRGMAGDGTRTVYFHGHFDVVPAQNPAQFRPQRRDGKISGRGAADMKGGLVSMLYGAAVARDLGLLGSGRIVFHFVCDEETGSAAGSPYLCDAGMIDPDALAMVTAEPTGGVVWHANRGAITMRVEVRGREAHVGQAHLGDNAFEKMIKIAEPLAELSHQLLAKRTAFPVESDAAAGSMLVVGGAAGTGANFNVAPGTAWVSIDRRLNPEEDLGEEITRLTQMIREAAARVDADISLEIMQQAPAASTAEDHPMSETLARCIAEVEGATPRFLMCLRTRAITRDTVLPANRGEGCLEDASRGVAGVVSDVSVLCPRTVARPDNRRLSRLFRAAAAMPRRSICHGLLQVATAGLHEHSIVAARNSLKERRPRHLGAHAGAVTRFL